MARNTRTYTYMVPFSPRLARAMAAATPEYDEIDARGVIDGWWRRGSMCLLRDGLMVTLHASALLTEDRLVGAFDGLSGIPRPLTRRRGSEWVLIRLTPAAMEASAKAARRLSGSLRTDTLRVRVLHRLVRDLYGA